MRLKTKMERMVAKVKRTDIQIMKCVDSLLAPTAKIYGMTKAQFRNSAFDEARAFALAAGVDNVPPPRFERVENGAPISGPSTVFSIIVFARAAIAVNAAARSVHVAGGEEQ